MLVQQLDSCADLIKSTKDSHRMPVLARELEPIHASLANNATSLPVGASLQVKGLDVRSCSFFTSFTTPLKLAFTSAEREGSLARFNLQFILILIAHLFIQSTRRPWSVPCTK